VAPKGLDSLPPNRGLIDVLNEAKAAAVPLQKVNPNPLLSWDAKDRACPLSDRTALVRTVSMRLNKFSLLVLSVVVSVRLSFRFG
jgi:hypothetical protein